MNKPISTIFFGTRGFAAQILQGMLDSKIFDIQLVITQPDQPVGRKQVLTPPPVKVLAERNGLKMSQPHSLKTFDFKTLGTFALGICVQYGLIIPQKVLDLPKFGIVNIHTSLLPKYRGASPIQSALVNGEIKTGVTIMKMDAGMDTGPILTQFKVKIDPDDIYPTLEQKLIKTAVLGLPEAILDYISGTIVPQPQDETGSTICHQLTRDDGKIDWTKTAEEIYNQYRGLTPWPGVWTTGEELEISSLEGKRIKLLKIIPSQFQTSNLKLQIEDERLFIKCGKNSIQILELQAEGGKPTNAKGFINGHLKDLRTKK